MSGSVIGDCSKTGCQGQVMQSQIQIREDGEKPLWIVVRNSGSLAGPEAFLDAPKILKVGDETYQLGCIILYDYSRHHFTSLQNVGGNLIYYDGTLGQNGELETKNGGKSSARHRVMVKGDYMGSEICVDHLLYVRCIDGESI